MYTMYMCTCNLEGSCSFAQEIWLFYIPHFFHFFLLTLLVCTTTMYMLVPSHYQLLWTMARVLALGYQQGNSNY